MSAPDIRIEVLFDFTGPLVKELGGFFILDTSVLDGPDVLGTDSGWINVTDNVMSFSINRGRSRDIDAFNPGSASVQFLNNDRKFDPLNTLSPFFGNILPMRQLRIFAIVEGTDVEIYRGFVQDWQVQYPDSGIWSNATAICADGLAILGIQELDEIAAAFTDDTSGERITRVLDLAEVDFPADLRNIDTGDTIFGNTTFGQNALSYLQTAERTESGSLFVSTDGKLTFIARNSTGVTTDLVFTDIDTDLVDRIEYQDIEVDFSTELLFNRIIVAGTTGNEQISQDTDSQEAFQIRTMQRTNLFMRDDSFAADMADFFLGRFSDPDFRFKSFEINLPGLTATKQQQVLELELADRIMVEKTPPGTGSPTTISQFAVIDGLAWTWTPGNNFVGTIRVSSGENLVAFTLDDAVLGVLDQNRLGL